MIGENAESENKDALDVKHEAWEIVPDPIIGDVLGEVTAVNIRRDIVDLCRRVQDEAYKRGVEEGGRIKKDKNNP